MNTSLGNIIDPTSIASTSTQAEQQSDNSTTTVRTIEDDNIDTRQASNQINIQLPIPTDLLQGNINIPSIISYTTRVMEFVEGYKTLTGDQKKKLVVNTIMGAIEKSSMSAEDKKFIATFLPTFIDTVILASKGILELNVVKQCCSTGPFGKIKTCLGL
jgi:hypothetical protein